MADRALRQIYAMWAFAVLAWGLMLFAAVQAVREGHYVAPAVLPLAVAGFFIWRRHLLRQHAALFLHSDSSALRRFNEEKMRRATGVDADALRAHANALAAAYYGEFDRAEECLATIEWQGRGGIYEALPLHVRALLDYWRDQRFERGVGLARRARDLATMPSLPGAATARVAYDTLVATGEVLARRASAQDLGALAAGRRKLPQMGRLLATWATAVRSHDDGDLAGADALLAAIREEAPFCTPLLRVPERRPTA